MGNGSRVIADEEGLRRVRDLFVAALERAPGERAAFVRAETGDDRALADEVLELLSIHGSGETLFLTESLLPLAAEAVAGPDEPALPDVGAGSRLGAFRLVEPVGRGASGVVWRARQDEPARDVAVKVLHRWASGGSRRDRFEREVEILARLCHPGIPPVLDAGTTADGRPWYAMLLVPGDDLLTHAREHGLDRRATVALVAELCDVVQAAHGAGVVHRDLKAENIRVDDEGRVRVLDFGIGLLLEDVAGGGAFTRQGEILGSLATMSPEQAAGEGHRVGPSADVWALGALLHELVGGRPPHALTGKPLSAAVRTLVEDDPEPLDRSVPPDLAAIVGQCLARDPQRRYADAGALAVDLRRHLAGLPVTARSPGLGATVTSYARRRPFVAGLLSLAAALLVGVTGLSAVSFAEARRIERSNEARRAELVALADAQRAHELELADAHLWPAWPRRLRQFDRWLGEAQRLLANRAAHVAARDALRARTTATEPDPLLLAELDVLEHLLTALDRLAGTADAPGLLTDMHARRARAAALADEPLDALWDEAVAAIAALPVYDGFAMPRQPDLRPLGPDPASGLWEFALRVPGDEPRRDPTSGELVTGDLVTPVFVLVPGAQVLLGATPDPHDARHDPEALVQERPLRSVRLDPFLVSRWELSRHQWVALGGTLPDADDNPLQAGAPRDPVAGLSWDEARATLGRHALELPTEAQWEYAARGGTDTPWWVGASRDDLAGVANARDLSQTCDPDVLDAADREVTDGWARLAPIDALNPNPFGLVAVHGNVWELCLDRYRSGWFEPLRDGDGLHLGADYGLRSVRGGSWTSSFQASRSAFRTDAAPAKRVPSYGVRPVRALVAPRRTATDVAGEPTPAVFPEDAR